MAGNLLDLANSMDKKAKAIEDAASRTAVDVASAIVGDLAYKTPVDTSNAISNWIVTLDSPYKDDIPPHYPGIRGSTYRASAAETVSNARAVFKRKKPGQPIFIVNNADYIVKLNNGSSKQAPAGFVARAILLGRKMIAKFKIRG